MTNVNQMSRQMGISKGKANSLMKTAKKMNGYQGGGSSVRKPTTSRRKKILKNSMSMALNKTGKEFTDLTAEERREFYKNFSKNAGKRDIEASKADAGNDSYGRKAKGFADGGMARIQGTPPAQVKGFTFNDNDGKGTF